MYKRGMGPQNAYNDQPQFINRTVLVTPMISDNVTIAGVPFDPETHGDLFAGRPVEAIKRVTSYQTQEGWKALWMGTRKHQTVSRWRRRVGHTTMARILQREIIRRVTFVKKASATNEGFSIVRSTSNTLARSYMLYKFIYNKWKFN